MQKYLIVRIKTKAGLYNKNWYIMIGINNKSIMKNNSIALISVFPLYTGTSIAVLDYRDALIDLGYSVKVYQLVIPDQSTKYLDADFQIKGNKFFIKSLELPYNIIFNLPKTLSKITEDIVFLTDPVMLNLNHNLQKSIIIFHDLREFSNFNHNPLRKLFFMYMMRNLKENDKVLAISHKTESDIKSFVKKKIDIQVVERCSRFNIDVNVINSRIAAIWNKKMEINVLYIAADRPYKNIELFIGVAKAVEKMNLNLEIKFILLSKLKNSTKEFIKREHLKNLQVLETVSNLYDLYSKTDVFLFPSLVEGFGLPLVEAMSFGIPIIYSSKQPMIDIVGDYGIAVDPFDINAWINELIAVLNREKYKKMALLSYERSKNYSFENFKKTLSEALKNFNLHG